MSSPRNPVGRVWRPEEVRQMMEICRKHHVLVILGWIHQDFVYEGHIHHHTASLGDYDEFLITMTAPYKTFNLAALQIPSSSFPMKILEENTKSDLSRSATLAATPLGMSLQRLHTGRVGLGWRSC